MQQWKKYLSSLGFTDSEVSVYLTALKDGALSVQDLARKAGVSRVTVYNVIESLATQGLMTSVEKGAKQLYAAEPPERVITLAQAKVQKMKSAVDEMKDRIQELKLIQNGSKPVVKLFEGPEAIPAIYRDFLASGAKELREFGNFDAENDYINQEEYVSFYRELEKKKIKRKLLFLAKESTPVMDVSKLEEIRLLPEDVDFNGDIFVYKNRVVLSTTEGKFISVIIESESIAKTVSAAFDLIWQAQEKKKKKK